MPTVSAHVPDDWDLQKNFSEKIRKHYRGKSGPYIRELMERDLRGLTIGTPDSAFSIEDITRGMRAETALLRASAIALEVLQATNTDQKLDAANRLAAAIIKAGMREAPATEDLGFVAEDKAHYASQKKIEDPRKAERSEAS